MVFRISYSVVSFFSKHFACLLLSKHETSLKPYSKAPCAINHQAEAHCHWSNTNLLGCYFDVLTLVVIVIQNGCHCCPNCPLSHVIYYWHLYFVLRCVNEKLTLRVTGDKSGSGFRFNFMLWQDWNSHHQEVKIVLYSIWYHHICRWPSGAQVEREPVHRTATYRCDDNICCIIQF